MSRGALQKMLRRSRYGNRTEQIFCTKSKKGSENRSSRFEPKILLISFSRGSGPPLKGTPIRRLPGGSAPLGVINTAVTRGRMEFNSRGVCFIKGGPEPLEKEIHKILGSKREDRFSDPFLKLVQKVSGSFFRTCFITTIYVRTRGHFESSRRSARR